LQSLFDFIKFEWLDDGLDLFHAPPKGIWCDAV